MPISYLHGGQGSLLPGIENALIGHQIGDRVEILLGPEEAYGVRDESLVFVDDIDNVPPQYRFIGAKFEFHNEAGESKAFYVTRIENGQLTVDGNRQTVTCIVNVVDVRDASADESRNGTPNSASYLH